MGENLSHIVANAFPGLCVRALVWISTGVPSVPVVGKIFWGFFVEVKWNLLALQSKRTLLFGVRMAYLIGFM